MKQFMRIKLLLGTVKSNLYGKELEGLLYNLIVNAR